MPEAAAAQDRKPPRRTDRGQRRPEPPRSPRACCAAARPRWGGTPGRSSPLGAALEPQALAIPVENGLLAIQPFPTAEQTWDKARPPRTKRQARIKQVCSGWPADAGRDSV